MPEALPSPSGPSPAHVRLFLAPKITKIVSRTLSDPASGPPTGPLSPSPHSQNRPPPLSPHLHTLGGAPGPMSPHPTTPRRAARQLAFSGPGAGGGGGLVSPTANLPNPFSPTSSPYHSRSGVRGSVPPLSPSHHHHPTNPLAHPSLGTMATKTVKKGCNCKNSRCLKLYCECFSSGRYCAPVCNCVYCRNNKVRTCTVYQIFLALMMIHRWGEWIHYPIHR